MNLYVFQTTLADGEGNVIEGADVSVFDDETGALAVIYADEDGDNTLSNPFQTTVNGLIRFYAPAGIYNLVAQKDGDVASYDRAELGSYSLRKSFISEKLKLRSANAMWSWWTAPLFVNDGRYAHVAPTRSFSQLSYTVQDLITGEAKTAIVDLVNFTSDDHNSGSIVSDGENVLVVYAGRRNTTDSAAMYYTQFNAGDLPETGLTKLSNSANNYPQPHRIGDEFVMLGRITQDGGVPQWTYRISGWPLTTWGAEKTLFQSAYTWPYIASRKSMFYNDRIILGLAWHPFNTDSDGSIRYGFIRRMGDGTGDWNFFDGTGSSAKGGLSTDYLMPLNESDFDTVFTPAANEHCRLLSIADEALLFCVWSEDDFSDAVYKYAKKVAGSWVVNDVVNAGRFMNQQNTVGYPLGACIGANRDTIHVCRESNGIYFFETKVTEDNGATWVNTNQVRCNYASWQDIIIARPITEEQQWHNWSTDKSLMRTAAVYGFYDEQSYQSFNTDIVDELWLTTDLQPKPFDALQMPIVPVFDTASRKLDLSDANKELTMTSGSAATYTVPSNNDAPFGIGTKISFYCNGADTTVQFAGGLVIAGYNSGGSLVTVTDGKFVLSAGATATITKVGGGNWRVVGDHNGVSA